ncbi:MAG TPA: NUDIX domain-containing protein [Candidatus Saccharimonadales bacterium]|nr:NUDIX domain-containing protein [Candidatus Saccharimonadales bacterium]
MSEKIRESAKLILVDTAGNVGLFKRKQTARHRPGTWDLLGGGLLDGEDFIDAAIREAGEESKWALKFNRHDLEYIHDSELPSKQGDHVNKRYFFLGKTALSIPQIPLEDHSVGIAVHPKMALDLLTHPPLREGLEAYVKRLEIAELSLIQPNL